MKGSKKKYFRDYNAEVETEITYLYNKLRRLKWSRKQCALIAPLTLEINQLKKQKNAVILAHSYQIPQIIFGVADFVGDSLGLRCLSHEPYSAKHDDICINIHSFATKP